MMIISPSFFRFFADCHPGFCSPKSSISRGINCIQYTAASKRVCKEENDLKKLFNEEAAQDMDKVVVLLLLAGT